MHKINVNERQSIEEFYSLDIFVQDAGRNARAKTTVMHGVRILSAPEPDGTVSVARANHHVGEDTSPHENVFHYPVRPDDNAWFDGSEPDADKSVRIVGSPDDIENHYRDFIDRVIEAARNAHFLPPIGRGEGRLKGFHGG